VKLAQITLIEANSDVNTDKAACETTNVGSHQSDMCSKPPANPAETGYTYQQTYCFHTVVIILF